MSEAIFSAELIVRLESLREIFPVDQPRSKVMMALRYVQEEYGYLSEDTLRHLADYLGVPEIHVQELVSFYSLYRREPSTAVQVQVCLGLPCALRGAQGLCDYLQTLSRDSASFVWGTTECQAACTQGPVVLVDGCDIVPLANKKAVVDFITSLQHEDAV